MNKEIFVKELEKLNIYLTKEQLIKLDIYYKELIKYNKNVNLTTIIEENDVYLKHFYDSLTLIKAVNLTNKIKICDCGTGAGFPGLVLKIVFPNLSVTLVDSLDKRIKFLNQVIQKLDLQDITTIHERIEKLNYIEEYDIVVSRAVAKTSIILELISQLPKVNGFVILMKANIDSEIEEANEIITKLSYKLESIINFKLPIENSERNLVVLKHLNHTKKIYPRAYSKIKNQKDFNKV